jgi:hypothetical protein
MLRHWHSRGLRRCAGFVRARVECNRRLLWEEIGLAEKAVRSDLLTSRERMA